jgi:hypothetical protein
MLRMRLFAEGMIFIALFVVNDKFKRPPRPGNSPLVSGIAPGANGNTRPLSASQLRQLEAWLRLHQEGWRRNIIPASNPSYMVQVEHSDGTTTQVYLFSSARSAIYFGKHGEGRRSEAGWLHPPAMEIDGLIALLREQA